MIKYRIHLPFQPWVGQMFLIPGKGGRVVMKPDAISVWTAPIKSLFSANYFFYLFQAGKCHTFFQLEFSAICLIAPFWGGSIHPWCGIAECLSIALGRFNCPNFRNPSFSIAKQGLPQHNPFHMRGESKSSHCPDQSQKEIWSKLGFCPHKRGGIFRRVLDF